MTKAPDGKTKVKYGAYVRSVDDKHLFIYWEGGDRFFYAVREPIRNGKAWEYVHISAEPHEDLPKAA